MNLCTAANGSFYLQALNLFASFRAFKPKDKIFLYYFDFTVDQLNAISSNIANIEFIEVPQACPHIHEPTVFIYKTFALQDCIKKVDECLIYSDAAACFLRDPTDIINYFKDDRFFLPYNTPLLNNKYWTTKKTFELMEVDGAEDKPQYWAGFQGYQKSQKNIEFLHDLYSYMKNPEIALPNPSVERPDGATATCVQHRGDQSVLSLLIHKHSLHQEFNEEKNDKYGDYQTQQLFNPNLQVNTKSIILSPRESKNGAFRYLKTPA